MKGRADIPPDSEGANPLSSTIKPKLTEANTMKTQDAPVLRRPFRNSFGCVGMFTDLDVRILHFLWRWKLARSCDLELCEGTPAPIATVYHRVGRRHARKFIEPIACQGRRPVWWQLTKKGFFSIRESLGDLGEEGFLTANPFHDQCVLAFQLGEFAKGRYPGVSFFTEQELRRLSHEQYLPWVPQLIGHRPDGFTKIQTEAETRIFAIEVELSDKKMGRFESAMFSYGTSRGFDHVLWLTSAALIRERLIRAKTAVGDETADVHLFVDFDDFKKFGWGAPVRCEQLEAGSSLPENTQSLLGFYKGIAKGNIKNFT